MIDLMRKIISVITGYLFLLTLAPSAYAQSTTNIDICPRGSFIDPICNLNADAFPNIVRTVIILLFVIAIIISLIFLIWGGIKWILSGGDKTGVESARNHIIAAIVGLIIAFAAFFIITLIGRIFNIDILNLQIPSIF